MSVIDTLIDDDLRECRRYYEMETKILLKRIRYLEERLAAANHTIQLKILRIAELSGEVCELRDTYA
jgi:hypothetical protein